MATAATPQYAGLTGAAGFTPAGGPMPAQLQTVPGVPYAGAPGGPHYGDVASGFQPGAPDQSFQQMYAADANGAQPQAPPDPMAAYLAQFNASLAQSRSGIDAQLKQALGELGQRRDAAAGVVAGLPAALQQSFAAGSHGLGNAAAAGQGALSQDVRGTVGALQAPLQAALAQDKAGGNAMSPFLKLANMANYQGGEAMLNQQAMAGKQALAEREQNFLQQMALQNAAHKQNEDDYYNHLNYAESIKQRDAADQSAQALGFTHADDLKAVEDSPAYRYALNSMENGISTRWSGGIGPVVIGGGNNAEKQTGAQIADKYRGNPDLLKALYANGKLTSADLARAGVTLPASVRQQYGY